MTTVSLWLAAVGVLVAGALAIRAAVLGTWVPRPRGEHIDALRDEVRRAAERVTTHRGGTA